MCFVMHGTGLYTAERGGGGGGRGIGIIISQIQNLSLFLLDVQSIVWRWVGPCSPSREKAVLMYIHVPRFISTKEQLHGEC